MEVLMHEATNGRETIDANGNGPMYVESVKTVKTPSTLAMANHISEKQKINMHSNSSHINRLSDKDSIDISFEDIKYTVSLGFRKGSKEILHGINGRLPAKNLIALLGPSGAGKSTLLNVLSGFKVTGVEGSIFVNGRTRDLNSFQKYSAYITQDDRLENLLTVIENMRIAADLKLSTDTPQSEKESIIEEILTTLGLYEQLNTKAGKLSGGQKKRLSIALELVNNPTVIFLDEPTTGLDSSSCVQVINLLKLLAQQGRTIICTIHQPSASLFQLFDQVYVLSEGKCLYQGTTNKLIPYLETMKLPCPIYHNPADYVIELACGEYGMDKVKSLVDGTQNGRNLQWFDNPNALKDAKTLRALRPVKIAQKNESSILGSQATSSMYQIKVLLKRNLLICKRDQMLTHLRIMANVCTGIMLGTVFLSSGNDGSRVLDNYNLLFATLMHHMMTTMMLTIVVFPTQIDILVKEHFNRWYNLKAFYTAITLIDIPICILCCLLFSVITYFMSYQPMELTRFTMFFTISLLVASVAQGTGLMVGAVFNVVNGTFVGPTFSVLLMMFAGFGVSLRDLPSYLKWGSYVSYLRYGLEGYVGAIYGFDRPTLPCKKPGVPYCHYRYPSKFLSDIAMSGDQFWNDVIALCTILVITRCCAFFLLRCKIMSMR